MSPETERVVRIPCDGEALHGVFHDCGYDDGVRGREWGMVFCDPFAEEKKCAHRVLVEAARSFALANFACLRFDYRGCGDSPGGFGDFGPGEWIGDILAATTFMREELGVARVGMLGLRLGATLGLMAPQRGAKLDFAVLWEPVVDGGRYLNLNLKRSLIKAMMTEGDAFDADAVRDRHADKTLVDFDGYTVALSTREAIAQLSLLADPPPFAAPTLILNLGSRDEPARGYRELAELMEDATVGAVVQEPFWNRIGLASAEEAIEATELWLAELQTRTMLDTGSREQ